MHFGTICPNKSYSMFIKSVRQGQIETPSSVSRLEWFRICLILFPRINFSSQTSGPVCLQTAWKHLWSSHHPILILLNTSTHPVSFSSLWVFKTILSEGDILRYVIIQLPSTWCACAGNSTSEACTGPWMHLCEYVKFWRSHFENYGSYI